MTEVQQLSAEETYKHPELCIRINIPCPEETSESHPQNGVVTEHCKQRICTMKGY